MRCGGGGGADLAVHADAGECAHELRILDGHLGMHPQQRVALIALLPVLQAIHAVLRRQLRPPIMRHIRPVQ